MRERVLDVCDVFVSEEYKEYGHERRRCRREEAKQRAQRSGGERVRLGAGRFFRPRDD